jgi:hypothetical protein
MLRTASNSLRTYSLFTLALFSVWCVSISPPVTASNGEPCPSSVFLNSSRAPATEILTTQHSITEYMTINALRYPTGSLWRLQSQQSCNTLTLFYFPSHSLHVSAPTGQLQVRYTVDYFYYNGSVARMQFDAEMLHVVHRFFDLYS